jgi:TolB-like protein/Tfp pilus assembly protein PilF
MSANRDPLVGRRLDSWKEIAAFFGRAERTVKRWETERKLPVHRVPGSGRASVFAYPEELTEWLKGSSSQELDADDSRAGQIQSSRSEPAVAAEAFTNSGPVPMQTGAWPLPRIAAWIVPFVLTVGVIAVLWAGRTSPRAKALASHEPATSDGQRVYLGPTSVAVLPFVNERGESKADYLSDGITESLIASLARIPQLRVRSRDSVFRYRGKEKDVDIGSVGNTLGVSIVVTGRVTLYDDTIDISAELTNVRDNTELWGHRYTGKNSAIVSLQRQIAGDIAGELRSSLSSAVRQQIRRQGTENAKAYDFYLQGRYAWNKRTRRDLEAAIADFNQAIAEDPQYALAYSGLADVYSVLHLFGGSPNEEFAKSDAAARKALELDPTLAHPHAVLGTNEMEYEWDFAGGESEFKKAIELDPNDATAHQWYAEKLSVLGRHNDAIAEINRAHELDPLSPVISRVMGGTLVDAGQYDQGIAVCQQLAQENPTFAIAHDCLFYAYWAKHMYAEAVAEFSANARLTRNPEDFENSTALERGFRAGGWPAAEAELAAVFEKRRNRGYSSPFMISRLYADRGDNSKAFEWLDIAYREHDSLLIGLRVWPQFASLRSDSRYGELVERIGLTKIESTSRRMGQPSVQSMFAGGDPSTP